MSPGHTLVPAIHVFYTRAADAERQDALQQVGIVEPVLLRSRGKLLDTGNLRIGIRLDVVGDARGGEAEVDARIAVELERAIDALGSALDRGDQGRIEVLGRSDHDVVALLIVEIVFDLFRGDEVGALVGHAAEFELPDRKNTQPLVAEHADIELAALDELLGDRRGADAFVDEGHALGSLGVQPNDLPLSPPRVWELITQRTAAR